ncbi:MAG: hypothetical protein AAGU19_12375 [Prolixibacteraceae bacterium]
MKRIRNLLLLIGCLFVSNMTTGQSIHPSPRCDIETVLRNIASNVIKGSSFRIIDTTTGETYSESENLPVDERYRVDSPYNGWKYWNGVLNIAFLKMAETFQDKAFADYVNRNVSFVFNHENYFRKQYEAGILCRRYEPTLHFQHAGRLRGNGGRNY